MEESKPKRQTNPLVWISLGIFALILVVTIAKIIRPENHSYTFVTVDHPVDLWQNGKEKWAYYSLGLGTTDALAEKARAELTPQGFTEDKSKLPWFRFVNGDKEVVVCNHDEFAVNRNSKGSNLVQTKPRPLAPGDHQWPCILVKNGPGTETPYLVFQVKKLVHGW